jgi:hypothetical protein
MHHDLLDPDVARRLPTPLARAIQTLAMETAENGVHTTADELSAAIEAFFVAIGRIWVAEYLAIGAPDAAINRLLHERLATGRPVLVGQWIGLSRQLRAVFEASDLPTVTRGLRAFDLGTIGDDRHRVARLSHYRNSFAHGSFHALTDDIVAHRELLGEAMAALPFLTSQPILARTADGTVALRAVAEAATDVAGADVPQDQPFLFGDAGRVLPLWPLAFVRHTATGPELAWTASGKAKGDAVRLDLSEVERYRTWLDRYHRELEGDVEGEAACLDTPNAPLDVTGIQQALEAMQRQGGRLLLLESSPGTDRRGLLAVLAGTEALRWRVQPGDLMGSGWTWLRAIARYTERQLGLERAAAQDGDPAGWRALIDRLGGAWNLAGRRGRLVVEDLHLGDTAAHDREPSVQQIWRALADGPWTVVGGQHRQWSVRPLAYDARVQLPDADAVDRSALAAFLQQRLTTDLHQAVLRALVAATTDVTVFGLCDALEAAAADGVPRYEPEVERALWDLAPLLHVDRAARGEDGEAVRTFHVLDRASLARHLAEAP